MAADYICTIQTDKKTRTSAITVFASCASDAEQQVSATLAENQTIIDVCLCTKLFTGAYGDWELSSSSRSAHPYRELRKCRIKHEGEAG